MQEMVLNAYLAYASRRAYVFDNYTWEREGPDIVEFEGKLRPGRIPLSAYIAGPIIGGAMVEPHVPRAISREYFLSVCPEADRVVLDTRGILSELGNEATVSQMVRLWVAVFNTIESRCVEFDQGSPSLFGYAVTNTVRVLDVFPALSASPILADFGWSNLILGAFRDNLQHFSTAAGRALIPPTNSTSITPIVGLLAVHVRRGDYETWCINTFRNSMPYTGFNRFPSLPDKYAPPPVDDEKNSKYALKHCLPSIPEIVQKIRATADNSTERVCVLTNASREWLEELVRAVKEAHPWAVSTSRDLALSWEAKFVSGALDMYVASRAEKFIGSGFSSLTSNIVMLRMHNPGLDPQNTHFW
ncbi:hypothetical protein C8J57DRAFT_1083351 [Mycena rebaudengoi]|nr:hypothetical protein C8J57DRAFT_1083351 [Mycena rebaudengoi]